VSLPPLTPNAWLRFDVVDRLLSSMPGISRVLEIGAGEGAVGARLARRYPTYVGVEPDERSAAVATERLRGADATGSSVVASLESVPLEPFDLVCAFEVLEHLEDDAGALARWRGRIRPGGWLLVSVPAYQERFAAADVRVGHFRRYDPDVIEHLVREAGFSDPEVYLYGFPLGYALEWGRNFMASRDRSKGEPIESRTAGSGRWFQPTESIGWLTRGATAPFRVMQRRFLGSRRGTGLVLRARS
jgi:SAM-dependent methyltransferase